MCEIQNFLISGPFILGKYGRSIGTEDDRYKNKPDSPASLDTGGGDSQVTAHTERTQFFLALPFSLSIFLLLCPSVCDEANAL
jgi:hypothetical protein